MSVMSTTTHKTMNTIIHAAFRRDIERFRTALAEAPESRPGRVAQLKVAWDNFAVQLHRHHHHEESIVWPAMEKSGVDLSLMGQLEAEHALLEGALSASEESMEALAKDPSAERTTAALGAITRLRTVLDDHLAHEERDLEPLLVALLGTPAIKAAEKEIRAASKGTMGTFIAWLQDGADEDAKAGLRKELPPPVLFVISRVGGREYRRNVAPAWA
jgi:hypothetical protein